MKGFLPLGGSHKDLFSLFTTFNTAYSETLTTSAAFGEIIPRPLRESEFAYGRSEASPDSEQIEHTVAKPLMRNSVSVEQIKERGRVRGKRVAFTFAEVFYPAGRSRKIAFTLAEVLITLGIIGVVAAMTMPTLIQNHKRSVVIQKLKKISTTIRQAATMANFDGVSREEFPANDPDAALEQFNAYYKPYLKLDRVEKGTKGVFGYLQDDTAIYFFKNNECGGTWGCTYIVACISHKACDNLDESKNVTNGIADGKQTFGLYTTGGIPTVTFKYYTHEERINDCKLGKIEACSALIFEAGWQIPKDYPIKL